MNNQAVRPAAATSFRPFRGSPLLAALSLAALPLTPALAATPPSTGTILQQTKPVPVRPTAPGPVLTLTVTATAERTMQLGHTGSVTGTLPSPFTFIHFTTTPGKPPGVKLNTRHGGVNSPASPCHGVAGFNPFVPSTGLCHG